MKTPHELACAISALINSKPRSPTVAELEGVIGEHWQHASVKPLITYDHEAVAKGLREMKSQLRRVARVELQTAEEAARYRAHIEWLEEKAKAWNSLRGGSHD